MVLYPDNPKRIQRVQDLANDIAGYQDEIKSQNIKQKQSDQSAYDTLAGIAKIKGYDSPEDYVKAAIEALPERERNKFHKLREEITKTGEKGETILFVSGVVATLGMVGGAALSTKGLQVTSSISSWVSGLRASATSIELSLAGAAQEASGFAEVGEEMFKGAEHFYIGDVAPDAGTIAAEGVEEVSTLVKCGRFVARATVVLSVLAVVGGLIYEGVEGDQQMKKCQKWINELCAKRYMVYKMKENVETAFGFMSKVYALLDYEQDVLEDEGTPEEKQARIERKIKKVIEEFGNLPAPVDETVYGSLRLKDESANSWTKEDPTLSQMKEYLKDLAAGKIKTEE